MPPVTLVSTRTSDGVLLQGAAAGPEDATIGIVAVHGAWGNFYSAPPAELLAAGPERGYRVVALNLRSHDLGSLGDGGPCIGFIRHLPADSALDLDAALGFLLDSGVERVVVVAHSYGAHLTARWLKLHAPAAVTGAVLVSPAPPLPLAARWFVDGAVDHHFALAARAVAEGDPHRVLVLSSAGPVPMVAEAATILATWGSESDVLGHENVADVRVPLLVTAGLREPSIYREYIALVAETAQDADLELLDEDHYYALDRPAFARAVLAWCERRGLP